MTYIEAKARVFLSQRPVLYPWVQAFWLKVLRKRNTGKYCTQSTDLCIEGFESSANTFVYAALQVLDEELSLAHHKHVVANLKRALRYDVPTLIMYRNPEDAIPSLVSRFRPGVKEATLRYVHFYRFVIQHANQFMLVSFQEATSNIGTVINRVNKAWNFQFPTVDSEEIEKQAKRRIEAWTERHGNLDRISLPREDRKRRKKKIQAQLFEMEDFSEAKKMYARLQDIRHQTG